MADLNQIQLPNGNTYNFVDTEGRKEANLEWGGKNFSSSYGCIDAAMVPELGANRLAFIRASAITIEYSRDSGSTWTNAGISDSDKVNLFDGVGTTAIFVGNATSSSPATAQYQTRITLNTGLGNVYTVLNKFVLYVTTNNSQNCTCKITAAKEATPNTYEDITSDIPISGWSGYNVINISGLTTYGNTAATQYGRVRFTFKVGNTATSQYYGLQIRKIFGFGGVGWAVPSAMARDGHLYTYDSSQNANFPSQITASQFNGALNGNASTATKATQDESGNNIKATYANSFSISDHTITLKNKNGSSLGTVTVPDNNTTYTFANGTNGFTVTPSGGSAQTVTVTPSITNNVTGSGTSGYIAKFNGSNTITNGPAIGSGTTKYLREDGTWQTPPSSSGTTYTIGTSGNNITLTPSSGSVQSITAPYATSAGSAVSATSATSATTASKLGSSNVGSATNPIYLNGGTATACTYSLNKTVPSDAVFTDTTYSSLPAASGGTDVSLVTTGEKYTWNNGCTDTKVTQTADNSTNSDFPILFAGTADDTTRTEGAKKSARIAYNPKSSSLRFKSSAGISYTDITNGQIALSATDGETGEVNVCTIINPSVIVLGNQASGDPLLTIYATSDGGVVLADRVNCNTMLVSDISEDYIPSKTSGNWSIGSDDGVYRIKAYRMGNLIQMTIAFHGNGSAVSSGSNGFVGTISGGPLPVSQITLNGFYSSSILAATLDTDGSITARPFSASCTLSSASRAYLTGTFICE